MTEICWALGFTIDFRRKNLIPNSAHITERKDRYLNVHTSGNSGTAVNSRRVQSNVRQTELTRWKKMKLNEEFNKMDVYVMSDVQ
jgi:hypothetical protein